MKIDLFKYSDYIKREEHDLADIKNSFSSGELSYWSNLDSYINQEELKLIKELATKIREKAEVLVVVGIGGSYMGSKAVVSALKPYYSKDIEIIYLGTNLDTSYYQETLEYLKDKDLYLNVISKSGETLEPSIAFQLVLDLMKEKYDDESLRERVIVTTSPDRGSLREFALDKNYQMLSIPNKIGGRFSVFTAVGLLPIAVAGLDLESFLNGARDGFKLTEDALAYALRRKDMETAGKLIEVFTVYEERLFYLVEWLKQLFGETQGKNNKAIYPSYMLNTRDLHSMGQYLQAGKSIAFETVIYREEEKSLMIDKYNKSLAEINEIAVSSVAKAHDAANRPSLLFKLEKLDEYNLGKFMQFMFYASIMGALLDDLNPFDQPGVEDYKNLINESLKS